MTSPSARPFAARMFAGQSRASKTRTSKARTSQEPISVSATRRGVVLAGTIGASLATAFTPFPAAAREASAADLQTVVYVGMTIDGFLARPDGALDFLPTPSDPNEDFGFAEFLASVDVVVMGRKTFDQVASFVADGVPWPYVAKRVYVVSRTMRQEDILPEALAAAAASGEGDEKRTSSIVVSAASPAETLRVVARDLASARRSGRPLRAYVDGGSVVRALLEEDLVDEMVLTTVPVLIGRGASLFGFDARTDAENGGGDLRWDVASTTRYEKDGLVKTRYVRKR